MLKNKLEHWSDTWHPSLYVGLFVFIISIPTFFALNMAMFWLLPGLPFWGVLLFTFGTSILLALMNAFGVWLNYRSY